MANPELINDDNLALATQDVVKTVLTALKKAGVDLPRRTAESLDKFINEFLGDKQTSKDFGKALQELGDRFIKNGEVTQSDIDDLMKKDVYKALNEKTDGGMLSAVSVLNSNGALGSTGGLISLASGIYQTAGGKLGGTPEERLAIAKEMVAFFGASQHFVNLGTNIIDKVNGSHLNAMLGLDKSLPEIFGKGLPENRPFTSEIGARFQTNLDELLASAPLADDAKMADKLDLSQSDYKEVIKGMKEGFSGTPVLADSNAFSRGAGAFLRVLDAGANTFVGVADTVLGGLMIKKGADTGDKAMIAQGAITVAAGAFGVGGGAASAGALAKLSFARAAVGPLFWISAALTIATLPFSIIEESSTTTNSTTTATASRICSPIWKATTCSPTMACAASNSSTNTCTATASATRRTTRASSSTAATSGITSSTAATPTGTASTKTTKATATIWIPSWIGGQPWRPEARSDWV